jgi:hypothetical protein
MAMASCAADRQKYAGCTVRALVDSQPSRAAGLLTARPRIAWNQPATEAIDEPNTIPGTVKPRELCGSRALAVAHVTSPPLCLNNVQRLTSVGRRLGSIAVTAMRSFEAYLANLLNESEEGRAKRRACPSRSLRPWTESCLNGGRYSDACVACLSYFAREL